MQKTTSTVSDEELEIESILGFEHYLKQRMGEIAAVDGQFETKDQYLRGYRDGMKVGLDLADNLLFAFMEQQCRGS